MTVPVTALVPVPGDVQKPTPDAVAKTGADVFGLLTAVAALLAAGGVTLSLRRRANR